MTLEPELVARLRQIQYEVGVEHGVCDGLQLAVIEAAREHSIFTAELETRIRATYDNDTLTAALRGLVRASDADEARAAVAAFSS